MIIGLAYRIAMGKVKELDDTREYDSEVCKPHLDSNENLTVVNNGMKCVKGERKYM